MSAPRGWVNPISVSPGHIQADVDPELLRPARGDLIRSRLEAQRRLIRSGRPRFTPIHVSPEAVIIDGHHYVRAAAEEGKRVDVFVSSFSAAAKADSIL